MEKVRRMQACAHKGECCPRSCMHSKEHEEYGHCSDDELCRNGKCIPVKTSSPPLLQAILELGDPEVRETATIDVGYNLQGAHIWCTPEGVKEYCAELVAEYRKMQETVRQQREQISALQRSLAIESYEKDGL